MRNYTLLRRSWTLPAIILAGGLAVIVFVRLIQSGRPAACESWDDQCNAAQFGQWAGLLFLTTCTTVLYVVSVGLLARMLYTGFRWLREALGDPSVNRWPTVQEHLLYWIRCGAVVGTGYIGELVFRTCVSSFGGPDRWYGALGGTILMPTIVTMCVMGLMFLSLTTFAPRDELSGNAGRHTSAVKLKDLHFLAGAPPQGSLPPADKTRQGQNDVAFRVAVPAMWSAIVAHWPLGRHHG